MAKISEVAELVRQLRGDKSQEEFARLFDVKPPTVSAWESGKDAYAPGVGACLKLGNLAAKEGRADVALFFWKQAGLSEQAVLMAAASIRKQRNLRPAPDGILRVSIETPDGEELGRELMIAAEQVLNPPCVRAILADGERVLLVDTSTTDIQGLRGEVVAVKFPPGPRNLDNWMEATWPKGRLGAGTLSTGPHQPEGHFWVAWLGEAARSYMTVDHPTAIGGGERSQAAIDARDFSPPPIKLRSGCKILGRVIGWHSVPPDSK